MDDDEDYNRGVRSVAIQGSDTDEESGSIHFHIVYVHSSYMYVYIYIHIIPLGNSSKECDNPGGRIFFFAKIGGLCTWLTRTPRFLRRPPWSAFFRESILRRYRHAFRFLQICENSCCAPAITCISDGLLYVFYVFCMLTGSRVAWTSLTF